MGKRGDAAEVVAEISAIGARQLQETVADALRCHGDLRAAVGLGLVCDAFGLAPGSPPAGLGARSEGPLDCRSGLGGI